MDLILLTLTAVLVLAVVALVLWQTERRSLDRIVTSHLRVRHLVTLKSGETFDGLLDDADARTLTLIQAKLLVPNSEPIKVDGSLLLFRSDVAYLQRP